MAYVPAAYDSGTAPVGLMEYWRAVAEAKLGVIGQNLAVFSEDWADLAGRWIPFNANGGSSVQYPSGYPAIAAPGALSTLTGGAANGSSYLLKTASLISNPYFVPNLRTKRWLIACRVASGAMDANARAIYAALIPATTTSLRVGLGFDGAVDATKALGGMFTGVLPANSAYSPAGVPKWAKSGLLPGTPDANAFTVAYIYSDAINVRFSYRGEPEIIACAAADLPAEYGLWLPNLVANINGSASAKVTVTDWSVCCSER